MRGRNSFLAREAEDLKMHASGLPKEICPAIFLTVSEGRIDLSIFCLLLIRHVGFLW